MDGKTIQKGQIQTDVIGKAKKKKPTLFEIPL